MFSYLFRLFILLLIIGGGLTFSSTRQTQLHKIAIEEKLLDDTPVKNAPPMVAFTSVALGSFRGLLADLFFVRSMILQDHGQYWEVAQLASWITDLQPRFSGATRFMAWNMAFNISVTCSDFADRWRWIHNGIKLLRDKAIPYNSGNPANYQELAWIYHFKMGNMMDDAHQYYKARFIDQMLMVLNGEGDAAQIQKLAELPEKTEDFLKTLKPDSVEKILQSTPLLTHSNILPLLDFLKKHNKLPPLILSLPDEDQKKVRLFLTSLWLRTEFKLEPKKMHAINQEFGELDWALTQAHAIYWAKRGLEHFRGAKDHQLDRIVSHALVDAFRAGRLIGYDNKNFQSVMTMPNLKLVDQLINFAGECEKRYQDGTFINGQENFIIDCLITCFTYGNFSKAKELFQRLKKEYPQKLKYQVDFDTFVRLEIADDFKFATFDQLQALLNGMLTQSFYYAALGEDEAMAGLDRRAQFLAQDYNLRNVGGAEKRLRLFDFPTIRQNVFQQCLKSFPDALAQSLRAKFQKEEKTDPVK